MKMSRKYSSAVAALAVAALTLTGCAGGGSPTADPGATDAPASAGGDLTILTAQSMTTWDPGSSTGSFPGVVWDRLYAVYGALFTVNASGAIDFGFADSFETTDGGATWTLSLKPDLEFTDGEAFDAEAVKANYDRFAADDYQLGAGPVASTFTSEVVDTTTLTITPTSPDPVLDIRIANNIPFIASPQSFPEGSDQLTEPVGAGPFTLDSWDQSVGETLVKNEDYFIPELPHLDSLTFTIVTDPAQRVSTVAQGGAQIMNGYPFQWVNEVDTPNVDTYAVPTGGIRHFAFNTTGELFSDVRARQAVQLTIDPTEFVQTLTQDPTAEGSTSLFPEDSPYYDGSLALPEQDTEAAQALVDEVTADGGDFTVDLLVAAVPELIRAGELLQLTLQGLDGVTVNLTQIPIQDWGTQARDKDDFDITFYPGVFDLDSPQVGFASLFGEGGLDHFSNFTSPEMDEALATAQAATTDEERQEAVALMQQIYVDEIPIVVFGIDYRSFFHTSDVTGFDAMGRGALYTDRIGFATE
ncbi:MAG: ABC transporter substrate-binding protein [Pseudoclavibacter sp.]